MTATAQDVLRYSAPASGITSGLGSLLDSSALKDVGAGFGGISGLYGLGSGIASGDPKAALGGAADIYKLLSNVPGLENLASAVPYLGPLVSLFNLGSGAAANPMSLISAVPSAAGALGTAAGTGALGTTLAAAAPALSSIGAFALPAAAAAFFATNTARKDAERKMGELHEWMTARRDLPTTQRQQAGALAAHQQMGDDLSQLSDEQLRNLTGATQTGLLSLVPGGHALMQLGSGEEFAGIKGVDISKPQALSKVATLAASRDYMRQADEFAKRGLNLGGDVQTAMHGSIYDSPEEQAKLNAPNAADMLKDWAIQFGPNDPRAKKVNDILDASRTYTPEGGAIEKVDIPDFNPGNYQKAFDQYTSGLMNIVPQAPQTNPDDLWQGGVYRGKPPGDYNT